MLAQGVSTLAPWVDDTQKQASEAVLDPVTLLAITTTTIALIVAFRYGIACWIRPFGTCRKCQGKRHLPNRIGRGTHECRRCKGTGLRLRWGRHLFNFVRRLHSDGTR